MTRFTLKTCVKCDHRSEYLNQDELCWFCENELYEPITQQPHNASGAKKHKIAFDEAPQCRDGYPLTGRINEGASTSGLGLSKASTRGANEDVLQHAAACNNGQCAWEECFVVRALLSHVRQCKQYGQINTSGLPLCQWCSEYIKLLSSHATTCIDSDCRLRGCRRLKELFVNSLACPQENAELW